MPAPTPTIPENGLVADFVKRFPLTATTCPADNAQQTDQSSFWDSNGIHWDQHRIGWAIAGGCALLTLLISMVNVIRHCRHYTVPREQRQILRILYMPPIYSIISFLSYRFFRAYTYYSLVQAAYESVTISAFVMLLIEYVAATGVEHSAEAALVRKDKKALPLPFCCWRYRPTKAYFMYTLKWSVLQYVIFRPAISIAGIICQAFNVLCASGSYSIHFAELYLDIVDFFAISVALYGLIVFYGLTREELTGRRPLAKFIAIKLIVMFTFYQGIVFSALESRGFIKATKFWTATNIVDGLNALAICIEMVFFAAFMMWAYTPAEYTVAGAPATSIGRPLWDSINFSDFVLEIWSSLRFFVAYMLGRPNTHGSYFSGMPNPSKTMDFGQAFGVEPHSRPRHGRRTNSGVRGAEHGNGAPASSRLPRTSFDEEIHLAPYEPAPSRSRSSSPASPTSPPRMGQAT